MATRPSAKLSYEDYLLFPDDGRRRELISGETYVTPAPTPRHQDLVRKILVLIDRQLETAGGGLVFIAPLDVLLSQFDVVQPDLVFVTESRRSIIGATNISAAPDLAIEVLSDPQRDRKLKRDLYERYGVQEYWLVDHEAERVEVYRLLEGRYSKPEILEAGDRLTTPLLPGLQIDVHTLFG